MNYLNSISNESSRWSNISFAVLKLLNDWLSYYFDIGSFFILLDEFVEPAIYSFYIISKSYYFISLPLREFSIMFLRSYFNVFVYSYIIYRFWIISVF